MFAMIALVLFGIASAGFIFFIVKYPRGSDRRLWGLRCSYGLGFLGVMAMRLERGYFSQLSIAIVISLAVSLLTYELSARYLK